MNAIKRILVATDFSAHSSAALEHAVDLARHHEASIDLLHVWEGHSYAAGDVFESVDARGPQASQAQLEFARTPHGRELERWLHSVRPAA
jgi:nucleotide-binding universal stress UspA family protein